MHGWIVRACRLVGVAASLGVVILAASPPASEAAPAGQATPYPGGKWTPPAVVHVR